MVYTLHRYIFRELVKVFALSAVALTMILSLGSVLRPVQEYGIGPAQVIGLMGYFLPIVLTFVLPMAALFAAASIYGRFACDNELDACRASGISMLTLVYPGLALAILVAIANLILSFHVMPAFIHRAESSLKNDAQRIIFRTIQRKGFYKSPDKRYLIYADHADLQNKVLYGVIVADKKTTQIERLITAETARVNFNPHQRFNEVQIAAYNTYQMAGEDEGGFSAEWVPITMEFGSLMTDDIKFKKIDEMKKIRLDPMRFYPVAKLAQRTYAQFATELLAQDITAKTGDPNHFYRLLSARKILEFTAGSCTAANEKEVELSQGIVVVEYDTDSKKPLQTLRSERALLYIEGDELAPTLTMEIPSPAWQRADGSEGFARRQIIRGLLLPQAVTDHFKTENVLDAIRLVSDSSALQKGPSAKLKDLQNRLWYQIERTFVEIKAEVNSRLVFGIGCIPMIMIGIGLGVIKKDGHLLAAFGASSIPAAVLIVCIMMGKNIATNAGSQAGSGVLLMWAGLVFLTVLSLVVYRKLLKH